MPEFRWNRLLRVVVLIGAVAAGAAQEERRQILTEIEKSLRSLQEITGLEAKKSIHYDLITRDKVNRFLKDRVKESVKPEELRADELTLKKLGYEPPDFNLEKSTIDLLT